MEKSYLFLSIINHLDGKWVLVKPQTKTRYYAALIKPNANTTFS